MYATSKCHSVIYKIYIEMDYEFPKMLAEMNFIEDGFQKVGKMKYNYDELFCL